jgi:hypothetical protein
LVCPFFSYELRLEEILSVLVNSVYGTNRSIIKVKKNLSQMSDDDYGKPQQVRIAQSAFLNSRIRQLAAFSYIGRAYLWPGLDLRPLPPSRIRPMAKQRTPADEPY